MPNLNAILGLQLVTVNVAQNQTTVNVALQGITLPSTESFYNQFYQVLVAGSTLTLPSGKSFSFYCRNQGTNPITVAFTPTAGTPGTCVLTPVTGGFGGVFMLFETAETSGGLTSVTLTATTATTPAEVFMSW
jgi:hypothetical protein